MKDLQADLRVLARGILDRYIAWQAEAKVLPDHVIREPLGWWDYYAEYDLATLVVLPPAFPHLMDEMTHIYQNEGKFYAQFIVAMGDGFWDELEVEVYLIPLVERSREKEILELVYEHLELLMEGKGFV